MKHAILLLIAAAHLSSAATYYIDFNAANDSANGLTTSTPWKRCPGMVGFAGSYTHANGDRFIFKGGVTWPSSALPLSPSVGGASGNRDYYGIDVTWFNGGSWTRPIFDGEYSDATLINIGSLQHINFEGLELKRVTSSSNTNYGLILGFQPGNITITNCYLHGWRTSNSADDAHGGIIMTNYLAARVASLVFENGIIENSENPGSANGSGGNGVMFRMWGTIRNSVLHSNSSAVLFCLDFDGNEMYNISGDAFDGAYHLNGVYLDQEALGQTVGYIRNSFFHDFGGGGENMAYLNGRHATTYCYNNVFWGQISDQRAINIDPFDYGANDTSGTYHIYNNTASIEAPPSNVFVHITNRGGSPQPASIIIRNNHVIGTSALLDDSGPAGSYTRSNNLIQSPATASGQGYVLGNRFAPTDATDATVNTGFNGSPVLPTSTDINGIVRPQAAIWDIGAYEFGAPSDLGPTVSSSVIQSTGTRINLTFSEAARIGSAGSAGWTLALNGGPVTMTYFSGDGTASWSYNLSRTVSNIETGSIGYTQPINGIEDLLGNDMSTFGGGQVTNNSTILQVNTPDFSPATGSYFGAQNITITCSTPSSTIRYTNDGTDPTGISTQYVSALQISASTTLKAKAFAGGLIDSIVRTASYEIGTWVSTAVWKSFVVPQQTSTFTWSFRASASSAGSDGVIGLSANPPTTYGDLSCLIRFNPTTNTIDVYNGLVSGYSATNAFTYIPGTTYEFVCTGNIATDTYSVTVAQIGGSPITIATNFGFRVAATELDNVGIAPPTAGTVTVSQMSFGGVVTIPTLASATVGANGTTLTVGYSIPVSYGIGGNGGWTMTASGGTVTLTPTLTPTSFTTSRPIAIGESGTISYVQPVNGVEATTGGGDLASRAGFGFSNQSTVDLTAPVPNPSTFSIVPTATGTASITMTATTSTDANSGPVQYFFNETSGNAGGSDSGWQSSPTFTDTGLAAGTQYTYRVRTRDSASTPNMTSFSSSASATTQSVAGTHPAMPFNVARANIVSP